MDAVSAERLLRLPVCVRGIELGRAVDVFVDAEASRALGLDVLCRDGSRRFLPLAAARVGSAAVEVDSPHVLLDLDQISFYRERAVSLNALRATAGSEGTFAAS
jgi:hypothetical protein